MILESTIHSAVWVDRAAIAVEVCIGPDNILSSFSFIVILKAVADDRHEKAMSAISWLQSFEANMKSGGQGGMHKGKKARK